ncbi:MAG: helix-turn-helix domain-containing protein [Acidiferrobacteraceae bacterium]
MRTQTCDGTIRCPVEACLEVIGGKWKGLIVFYLLGGTKRFNELRRLLPGVTQRMLTRQLRELEADRIIQRTTYDEVPPRVEYSLTEFGTTLETIIRMLQKWGMEYLDEINAMRQEDPAEGEADNAVRLRRAHR